MRLLVAIFLASAALSSSAVPQTIGAPNEALDDCAYFRFGTESRLTGPFAQYVQSVGRRVARAAKMPRADTLQFVVMDSEIDNAVSCPTGIYISREYIAELNDEAELAAVLGHEIGHKTAGHVVPPEVSFLRSVLGIRRPQSPAKEREADKLAMQYLIAAGYDPIGAVNDTNTNLRLEKYIRQIGGKVPVPQTHPPTLDRLAAHRAQAQASGKLGKGVRNREQFLRMLDGIRMEGDPSKGITFANGGFLHPVLRIAFSYPPMEKYDVKNADKEITIAGPDGVAQFSGRKISGSFLDGYIANTFQQVNPTGRLTAAIKHFTVNGIPAASMTQKTTYLGRQGVDQGTIPADMSIVAYQFDKDSYYHFVIATPVGTGLGPFKHTIESFRKIDEATARMFNSSFMLRLHKVAEGETSRSLASHMEYGKDRLAYFLFLNDLEPSDTLRPGQVVKLVVRGAPYQH